MKIRTWWNKNGLILRYIFIVIKLYFRSGSVFFCGFQGWVSDKSTHTHTQKKKLELTLFALVSLASLSLSLSPFLFSFFVSPWPRQLFRILCLNKNELNEWMNDYIAAIRNTHTHLLPSPLHPTHLACTPPVQLEPATPQLVPLRSTSISLWRVHSTEYVLIISDNFL